MIEVVSVLPESVEPYVFLHFKRVLVAVNAEHGCFAYDEEEWKPIRPATNQPLFYHESHFYSA